MHKITSRKQGLSCGIRSLDHLGTSLRNHQWNLGLCFSTTCCCYRCRWTLQYLLMVVVQMIHFQTAFRGPLLAMQKARVVFVWMPCQPNCNHSAQLFWVPIKITSYYWACFQLWKYASPNLMFLSRCMCQSSTKLGKAGSQSVHQSALRTGFVSK